MDNSALLFRRTAKLDRGVDARPSPLLYPRARRSRAFTLILNLSKGGGEGLHPRFPLQPFHAALALRQTQDEGCAGSPTSQTTRNKKGQTPKAPAPHPYPLPARGERATSALLPTLQPKTPAISTSSFSPFTGRRCRQADEGRAPTYPPTHQAKGADAQSARPFSNSPDRARRSPPRACPHNRIRKTPAGPSAHGRGSARERHACPHRC